MVACFALLLPIVLLLPLQERDAVSRRELALAIARAYATHEWTAQQRNVLHGADPDGVRVDTPDADHVEGGFSADGSRNIGIPYQWGGFSSLAEFDAGLRDGRYAGHVPEEVSNPASAWAVGVDCSGFVSRCWELPLKQSTRSLGRLCRELESYGELEPGDLLLSFDGHAMLFAGFDGESRERLRVFEAAIPRVIEAVHAVEDLASAGLRPQRYKPFDASWIELHPGPPAFTSDGKSGKFEPGGSVPIESLPAVFDGAKAGEWARYDERRENAPPIGLRRAIARVGEESIELQIALELGDESMETSETRPSAERVNELLLAFLAAEQELDPLEVEIRKVESGTYVLGERPFDAWRVTALVHGRFLVRGERLALRIEIEMIGSSDIPVEGIIHAEYRYSFARGDFPSGKRTFVLVSFGNASDER